MPQDITSQVNLGFLVDGQQADAADVTTPLMNLISVINDMLNGVLARSQIMASVRRSSSQPLNDNALTPVEFNFQETPITAGMHSTSVNPSRLIAVRQGWHTVLAGVRFASNATGRRELFAFLNGSTQLAGDTRATVSGNATLMNIAVKVYMQVGWYVEIHALQNSGGVLNLASGAGNTWAQLAFEHE
jgi:hypothetical protein